MSKDTVVPAFPYEGALYWFFADKRYWLAAEKGARKGGYYGSLYDLDSENIVPRATALVALFDKIVIAPAPWGK